MNKIDLPRLGGILANVGALVGLLLLAFERNQNRQLTRAQIRHELAMEIVEQQDMPSWARSSASDPKRKSWERRRVAAFVGASAFGVY